MSDGIFAALSGAVSQEKALDVIANNVANASTTGFRADQVTFREALVEAENDAPLTDAIRYVYIDRISSDLQQGPLAETGNPLDVAIQGSGWFEVQTSGGPRYTRAGNFVRDEEGTLKSLDGHKVSSAGGGDIQIPQEATKIQINRAGQIFSGTQELGQIRVVTFENERALEKEGLNLFRTDQTPVDMQETAALLQGYLENSNVNAVGGMHKLIVASRSFDAFQKVIEGFGQMDQRAARDLGEA